MKKLIVSAGIILLTLSGAAYAQSTTLSTNPNEGAADKNAQGNKQVGKKNSETPPQSDNRSSAATSTQGKSAAASGAGTSGENSTKAGNAGTTGSKEKSVSTTNKAQGAKDSAPQAGKNAPAGNANGGKASTGASDGIGQGGAAVADEKPTAAAPKHDESKVSNYKGADIKPAEGVKKGSGSSKRNTKNKTGVTGNADNRATKQSGIK